MHTLIASPRRLAVQLPIALAAIVALVTCTQGTTSTASVDEGGEATTTPMTSPLGSGAVAVTEGAPSAAAPHGSSGPDEQVAEPPATPASPTDDGGAAEPPDSLPPFPAPTDPTTVCDDVCGSTSLVPLQPDEPPASDATGADSLSAGTGVSAGCAVNCFVSGSALAMPDGHGLIVDVVTSHPATITVWVTGSQPALLDEGDGYRLRVGDAAATAVQPTMYLTTDVVGLDRSTDYWVTVVAKDAGGGRSWVTGRARTAVGFERDVQIEFVTMRIDNDGDRGPAKGEVFWQLDVDDNRVASSNTRTKVADGDVIDLLRGDSGWYVTDADTMPTFTVTMYEDDWSSRDGSAMSVNTADSWQMTWTEASEIGRCSLFDDVSSALADWHCIEFFTTDPGAGGNAPQFTVVVAYRLDPPPAD